MKSKLVQEYEDFIKHNLNVFINNLGTSVSIKGTKPTTIKRKKNINLTKGE